MYLWAGEVNMAIFCSCVGLDLQLCLVGKGGGFEGLYPFHQLLDSHCRMGLLVLSLLKQMAVCLVREFKYRLRGGIGASSSNAWVGVVWKAAHIRWSTLFWTFVQYLNVFLFACPPGSTSISNNRENACAVEEVEVVV